MAPLEEPYYEILDHLQSPYKSLEGTLTDPMICHLKPGRRGPASRWAASRTAAPRRTRSRAARPGTGAVEGLGGFNRAYRVLQGLEGL